MNRPIALVCYICGRQFGTKSLAFHLKACEKKWENEENLKPPKQRRPCPQPPRGLQQLLSKDRITKGDINKFNSKSYDTFVEDALVQCQYCGRRFNPKSLIPHQKACKINPMIKKSFVNKGAMGKYSQPQQPIKLLTPSYNYKEQMGKYNEAETTKNLVPCRRCGRNFLSDRVGKHERVCKADPVTIKQKKAPAYQKKVETNMKSHFGTEKKAKWKIQHQELQNAMKAMRQVKAFQAKGGKLSDLPPPPPSNYDHYVQCRYCGRKYAPDVAERHIPKCANIINKPGGIKPSKIQQKYIPGTGSGMTKISTQSPIIQQNKSNMNNSFKPNFSTPSSYHKPSSNMPNSSGYGYGNYSNYEYTEPKGERFGGRFNNLQSKKYEMPNNYGYSSSFGNNLYPTGSINKSKVNASYQMVSNNLKSNSKNNSKPYSYKYW